MHQRLRRLASLSIDQRRVQPHVGIVGGPPDCDWHKLNRNCVVPPEVLNPGKRIQNGRIPWLNYPGELRQGERFVERPLIHGQRIGEVVQSYCVFRFQFDYLPIPLDGGIVLACLLVQERELEVRSSETRCDLRSLFERPPGARRIAAHHQRLAEKRENNGTFGHAGQRARGLRQTPFGKQRGQ